MAKKTVHQSKQAESTRIKRKGKKHKAHTHSPSRGSGGAQASTQQATPPMEEHPDMQAQRPGATTSGHQLAAAHHLVCPPQDTVHTALLSQAVLEAVNTLITQNWDMSLAVATQALYRLNIDVALHILETVTTTAPDNIDNWIRDRAMAALLSQQQQVVATPDAATRALQLHSPQPPQLTSLQISKQIAMFGRYPHKRPFGMLADLDGRLSLHNLMSTWGTLQGLSWDYVKAVLQQHGTSNKGQRFTTTAVHDDIMIEVSRSERQNTPPATHTTPSYQSAIGAQRPTKHHWHR